MYVERQFLAGAVLVISDRGRSAWGAGSNLDGAAQPSVCIEIACKAELHDCSPALGFDQPGKPQSAAECDEEDAPGEILTLVFKPCLVCVIGSHARHLLARQVTSRWKPTCWVFGALKAADSSALLSCSVRCLSCYRQQGIMVPQILKAFGFRKHPRA